tara:strand:+ start:1007 stop:1231 length:225 start_codon:yes stop_codon:yes gene_type:complete
MPKIKELMYPRYLRNNVLCLPDELIKHVIVIWHPIINMHCYQFFYYHIGIYTKRKGWSEDHPQVDYRYFLLLIT